MPGRRLRRAYRRRPARSEDRTDRREFAVVADRGRCRMGVEVLDLAEAGSPACSSASRHRAPGAVAVFRPGGHVVGVGAGAVADELGERRAPRASACSSASITSMPAPSPMTKPSRALSNGRDASVGLVVEAGRQRTGRGEAAEADPVDAGLRAAADRDVGLARPDQPRGVADRLDARGAGGHRRAERPLEAVPDATPVRPRD